MSSGAKLAVLASVYGLLQEFAGFTWLRGTPTPLGNNPGLKSGIPWMWVVGPQREGLVKGMVSRVLSKPTVSLQAAGCGTLNSRQTL